VGLFRRRKETLNEQLLREAGIDPAGALGDSQPPALEATPPSILRIAGVPDGSQVSPRQWDASTVVEAPGLAGDRIEFTTIPDGDVIVSEEIGDADVSPLADAVERHVDPDVGDAVGASYFVEAARIDGDLWEVRATGF